MRWQKWAVGILAVALAVGTFGVLGQAAGERAVPDFMRPGIVGQLSVEGARQGYIAGGDRQTTIDVLSFDYQVTSPRDAASGQATGKRQHKPLMIRKSIDKASPLLFQALVTNEMLRSVSMQVRLRDGKTYTITLTNANLVDLHETNGIIGPEEELSFTFQKITIEHESGITAMDDWESPVS
jgi:type VI secretion system secreted protein Hcp